MLYIFIIVWVYCTKYFLCFVAQEFVYTEATDAGPTAESGPAEESLTEAADSPQQKSQQQEQSDKTAPPAKYVICFVLGFKKILRMPFFVQVYSEEGNYFGEEKDPKKQF